LRNDGFLQTYDHPKLNPDDINHLNRSIASNGTEATIAIQSPKKEMSRT
jgi:hypothetical protein